MFTGAVIPVCMCDRPVMSGRQHFFVVITTSGFDSPSASSSEKIPELSEKGDVVVSFC